MQNRLLRIWRGMALLLLAGLLASTFMFDARAQSSSSNRPPAPRRPSIIFILADDLGYGDLGCYGQTQIKTPNIDKLAEDGMRFTSCYAGSTVCAPSRGTLMTGKHTGHARIRGNSGVSLQAEDVTVAELLKSSGYRTACIGKWGLGHEGSPGLPGKKGFEEWIGYLDQVHAHDYYPTYLYRSNIKGEEFKFTLDENEGGQKGKYSDDLFTETALNFIKINKPDQFNKQRPFFLYLTYTIPHANNELGKKTGNGMEVPSDAPYSGESWPQVEKNKAAMITRMDRDIGRIMDFLKKSKIDENTMVVFASDNGPHKEGGADPKFFNSAGGLRGIKRDLYEGGIRVPFIVRWPARVATGTTSDLPCAFWDFLPTATEIAGVKPPKEIDGISILPTLTGRAQTNRHEFLYWEFHEKGFKQAVRMGDWKAVRFGVDGPIELYNLKTDVAEKKNVADKNPEVVAKIEEYLKKARTEDSHWPAKTVEQNAAGQKKDSAEQPVQ
ncbi:MAG: N-acetylgalactosamine-6-sulfatase [Pedosphaera sp.]|nr:N-acetylgalactosamine-6-sulfatase [Pedosphaera sp.]